MADALPILVKAVTITSGTGTISLSDPSGQESFRTDSEAVDDGSLTSGDTVTYVIRDDTGTAGSGPAAEWGYGTYTKSGGTRTITRTAANVLDSFDGSSGGAHGGTGGPGVLLDWAASGQRDVYLTVAPLDLRKNLSDVADADTAADNLGAARLNAGNTFVEEQVVFNPSLGSVAIRRDQNGSAGQVIAYLRLGGRSNTGSVQDYCRLGGVIETAGTGTQNGVMIFQIYDGGSPVTRLRLDSSGVLSTSAGGDVYDHFPAGTKMLFGTAPPAGWTRVNEAAIRTIKLAESGETVGSNASADLTGLSVTVLGHTLTISEMPAHTHGLTIGAAGAAITNIAETDSSETAVVETTGSTGGGGSHTHGSVISGSTNWHPPAQIWAAATKD